MGTRQKVVLCDTNVILEFFKGDPKITEELKEIQRKNVRISVVTSMEIIYGSLNKQELKELLKKMGVIETIQITPEISQLANNLMIDYSLSHDLDLSDSLIAATALLKNIELYTLNLKHFRYIPDLKLYQPVQ